MYINPRSKVLWHADRLSQLRYSGRTVAPINVEIDLSNRCSHGCSWCHFAHTHTRGPLAGARRPAGMLDCGDLMDTTFALDLIDQLGGSSVRSITWSGGGEPTLHPQFTQIVEHAANWRHGRSWEMQQGLYTHGGHIDAGKAAVIKKNMTFVYVSLDECNAESFKASKGVNRFDHVLAGISELVAAPGPATVGVGFLMHPGNADDIDRMVDLGRSLGVDYVQFRPIVNYDQDSPSKLAEDTAWIDTVIDGLEQHQGDPFVYADVDRFRMYQNWQGHGYNVCNWASMQTVITPNGKVWRCVNRRGHEGALLGDLTKDSFCDIWHRLGGPCAVSEDCRLMCRGHIANVTLAAVLTEPAHSNFV